MGEMITVVAVAIGYFALGFMAGYFYYKDQRTGDAVLGYPNGGAVPAVSIVKEARCG